MILNYKKYGETGPNLIILHGLFGMLDNWHTLGVRFGASFQTWTIDQRNHGKSPHSDDIDYNILAKDLLDFCEQHQIEQPTVLGHSMGGKAAMQFAVSYPDHILKLIVVDIAPKDYPEDGHDVIIEALRSLHVDQIKSRKDADDVLGLKIPEEGVRQFLLKNLTREGDHYILKMNFDSLSKNYDKLSANIETKGKFEKDTLFIRGEKSRYILDSDISNILHIFPKAQFVTIPDVGHWVHAEAPDAFYETVFQFMNLGI
jgi:esterase